MFHSFRPQEENERGSDTGSSAAYSRSASVRGWVGRSLLLANLGARSVNEANGDAVFHLCCQQVLVQVKLLQ